MKKIVLTLFMALLMCFCFTSYTNAKSTTSISKKKENGFYVVKTNGYLNTVGDSTIILPEDFNEMKVEGVSLLQKNKFVSANIDITKNKMTIQPTKYLTDGATYTVRLFASNDTRYTLSLKAYNIKTIDYSKKNVITIPANPEKGFNYPYYLAIPEGANTSKYKRIIVEPNNTGKVSDIDEFHAEAAKLIAEHNGQGSASENLKMPLLVPAFPRPLTDWWDHYYHTLSKDVMLEETGKGARVDLQLIAMIKDAQSILEKHGLKLEKKVFMTGFSASGQFVNRFTVLHPEWVKAVFHGGFTMYPVDSINGVELTFPLGIADIKQYTGKPFNEEEYRKVAQFVYTGDLDQNDNLREDPGTEDYYPEHIDAMIELYGNVSPMKKWAKKEKYMNDIGFGDSIQFHIYKGIGHGVPQAVYHDILDFFSMNHEGETVKIKAHTDAWYYNYEEIRKKYMSEKY